MPDGTHGAADGKDDEISNDFACEVNNVEDEDVSQEGIHLFVTNSQEGAPLQDETIRANIKGHAMRNKQRTCEKKQRATHASELPQLICRHRHAEPTRENALTHSR